MAAPLSRSHNTFRTLMKKISISRWSNLNSRIASVSSDQNNGLCNQPVKDPFPLYSSHEVQTILHRITGFDIMKVAGPRKKSLMKPVYKLLTDDELFMAKEAAKKRLSEQLKNPPPYMNPRKPITEPLSVDPDLAHFDTSKYVFTDISFGVKDRARSVVVREVDGTLRVAPFEVKDRVNQIYNPQEGRSLVVPKLFQEEYLERLISQNKFVYILERACAQFEPDDPDFLRVCHRVYSAVNTCQQFEVFRSTRFFAPLAFHLVWTKMVDLLLIDMLTKDLESDARDIVKLYSMVHPDGSCAQRLQGISECDNTESVIRVFLETEASKINDLELSLQTFLDRKGIKNQVNMVS